jgi:hypothetical protein
VAGGEDKGQPFVGDHRVLQGIFGDVEIPTHGHKGGCYPPPFLTHDPVDNRLCILCD